MKLSAYLSPSRHGVYYFRWPLPRAEDCKRRAVRISLRTKCPDRAGDLARYLASCGRLVRDNKTLARLRQDQIRDMVRRYFMASLDRYVERLNDTGLKDHEHGLLTRELEVHEFAVHEEHLVGHDEVSDLMLDAVDTKAFRTSAGLSDAQWAENEPVLRREMRKGRRDQIRAILSAAEGLESYSFAKAAKTPALPPQARSAPLVSAIDDFMDEHASQWTPAMASKARAYLVVLLEHFGPDRALADITRQDASEMKKVAQALPANRNTKPETRDLTLAEAIAMPGLKKISAKTLNSYIDTFRRFWDWAERHGHAPHKLFEGMKVAKAKQAVEGRKPFSQEQTAKLYDELTENRSALIKKDDHKWGALLGLYTGARLREIAQLDVADIREEHGIWHIDINENAENKSLKSKAAKRRVPIHSDLIQLGFLDFVKAKPKGQRLFMAFSYNAKEGYGRNLGRWFNTVFLPGLNLKESGLVFHSLRHTMVTRLA
jgi:integrase